MTRSEAIEMLKERKLEPVMKVKKHIEYVEKLNTALDMAIEALNAQEYDEVVFDMNEFFSIVDDGKIIVIRRGRGRVTVERPAIRMETTICSYGERSEE